VGKHAVQEGAGVLELLPPRALRQVARDRHEIRREPVDLIEKWRDDSLVEPAEVQVREMEQSFASAFTPAAK
jgi:hypothetical protein